ncbi:phosphotransferase [Terrabacter sp. Root85]|uniref:phosphotransferase n=1 Tax=Terrabacter sp. Root85 TaxID=1736603 RepID=UPI0009EB4AD1
MTTFKGCPLANTAWSQSLPRESARGDPHDKQPPCSFPTPEPDLLCHNDLTSWNLIIDEDRLVFIDWDGAGPSTRGWDLAYAAISVGHLFPGSPVRDCAARLRAFLEG